MRSLLFLFITILIFPACSTKSDDSSINNIEYLIEQQDFNSAQKLCNNITQEKSLDEITLNNLCRLSVAYMKLSEYINHEENIAMATKCYHIANDINSDSVTHYFSELSIEDTHHEIMLKTLSESIDLPCNINEYEPIDSCEILDDYITNQNNN